MLGLLLRDAGGACFFPPAGHRLARKQQRAQTLHHSL